MLSRMIRPAQRTRRQVASCSALSGLPAGRNRRPAIVTAHCLSQGLLVRALLRQRGLDAVLQVGVRKDGGELDAHAGSTWTATRWHRSRWTSPLQAKSPGAPALR